MRRGFAAVHHPDGRPVRSVGEVSPGSAFSARLADGTLEAEVRKVRRNDS